MTAGDRPVGVVADDARADLADRIADAIADASENAAGTSDDGGEAPPAVRGSAGEVVAADPGSVVAVGESSLLALVRAGVSAPVLPVAAGPGYGGVGDDGYGGTRSEADGVGVDPAEESLVLAAVEALVAGEFGTESRTVLDVSVGGERVGRALADATLVTAEPARISEYAVETPDERVARFRADGVVVSTPTGSHGYGRSAGGPVLEPGSGVVSVVPVAPFAVNVDRWVVSADEPVALTVERDEGEVSLLVDDRTVRSVPPETPVELVADGTLDVVRTPESRPFFER